MPKFRSLLTLSLALALLAALAGPAVAGPKSFTFAHFIPPNEPGAEVGLWIEKDLNEQMGDKIKAKFFHSGQMGNEIEIVKKVRMGTLQAGISTGNYAPELNPKFGIATLAYCMDTYPKWEGFLANQPLRDELFTCLSDKGLLVLDISYFGSYGFATTKPVNSLEELKSFKMRTTQARYPLAFWNALGVNPVPMAWGDVFPALKQGVVDGTDQTENVTRLRLADVCKYFTRTKHMIGLFVLYVNQKWWNGLDPDTRAGVAQIIAQDMAKARAASMELTKTADASLKDKGVTVIDLSPAEMAKFKASQKQVWQEFAPEIGQEWLDKVQAFTATVKE
ncbi:MAG: TRAP transporter substrate-binding protein [Deltaproteobacteria bacterium]|nr:TRAP transporter substrate-binding protein [Deltaproteobacteria bacterium]